MNIRNDNDYKLVTDDSITSLKDINTSDRKKLSSNVIHGRKASTYLRIFRDDEGLTDNHDDRTDQQTPGRKAKRPVSLHDTHYKFSLVPRRKSSRSQEEGVAKPERPHNIAKALESATSQSEKTSPPQSKQSDLALKPVSSATYYPHKSRGSSAEPTGDWEPDEMTTAMHVVPRFQYRGTPVPESTASSLASITHEHVALSPEKPNSGSNSEAIESDDDYYDESKEDEDGQDSVYPLAVELQPFNNNVGGHTAIFRFSKRAVCKALVNRENKWYENIEVNHKELLQFMPRYIGVLNVRQHFQNKEDFLRELSSSQKRRQLHSSDVPRMPVCSTSNTHSNSEVGVLPEVVLSDNRHMVPDSMLNMYPSHSPSSAPTDSYLQSLGKTSSKDSTGSTTVNTKLKELVLQEVFSLPQGDHDNGVENGARRPRRPSMIRKTQSNSQATSSSHSGSRRGSNYSLKNIPAQGSGSPLLKKSIQETISHALNSPSSMMDLNQFQKKEMAREKSSRRRSSYSSMYAPLEEDTTEREGTVSPLSLPRNPPTLEEECALEGEDGNFSLDGNQPQDSVPPAPPVATAPRRSVENPINHSKDNESITFEEQSDTIVSKFILLEDLTRKLNKPCALDLKMGTRQYGVDAKPSKQRSQREKCLKTTSKKLGVRICGLKIWNQTYYITRDKYFGRRVQAGWQFTRVLARFIYDGIHVGSVVRQIPRLVKQLDTLGSEISRLKGYRLYGSSLLLMLDGSSNGNESSGVKVNLIDFARCVTKEDLEKSYNSFRVPPKNPELEDRGFLRGVRSLKFYLFSIWNYLTNDAPLCNDDEELQELLKSNWQKFDKPWDWLDEFDKENEEEFNSPTSELRKKWRKYELIFDVEPRYSNDGDVSD
ncbi:related to Inositol hexakisphosphate kinase 1 [Zygosaccharomyces bailii]|nr:related to Inositol hexakisphosphate kinase 1 [Zygosaccharomyces bailii]